MEKQIFLWAGFLASVIAIIKGIIEMIRIGKLIISPKTAIIILLAFIFLLVGILIKPKCKNPDIKITFPSNNSVVKNPIDITGKVKCCPSNYQVALIVHRKSNGIILEKWFIHPDFASIKSNSTWTLPNVSIGTSNTHGTNYELFAYLVQDSVASLIQKIVSDPLYQGTFNKPNQINGVYNKIIVRR